MSNYNGYSNRETWATALHISNTEELYLNLRDIARHGGNLLRYAFSNGFESAGMYNTKRIYPSVEALEDIGDLSLVNWAEVAEALNA